MKLQLHRSGRRPQWAAVRPGKRNSWQRLAAASRGVLAPANAVTLAGFVLVLLGLVAVVRHAYLLAVVLLVAGRLADLLDGYLAEKTGTKSPLGEKLDASMDKLETAAAVVVLVAVGVLPVWLALVLTGPHLATAVIALYGLSRGHLPHPSRLGKAGMALAWAGLGLLVLARAGQEPLRWLAAVGSAVVVVAAVMAVVAAAGYSRGVFRAKA